MASQASRVTASVVERGKRRKLTAACLGLSAAASSRQHNSPSPAHTLAEPVITCSDCCHLLKIQHPSSLFLARLFSSRRRSQGNAVASEIFSLVKDETVMPRVR